MTKEYSYGAVVYQIKEGKIITLIEHMALGHISLPKGHIEKGETPLTCTLREIKEETNLDVEVDMSFSHTITYSPKPHVSKDVTFFLATPTSSVIKPQLEEVAWIEWVEINKAISLVTHESDKETLRLAKKAIEQKHA